MHTYIQVHVHMHVDTHIHTGTNSYMPIPNSRNPVLKVKMSLCACLKNYA